ncbi:MAG TPA: DUF378 domain-containing protein [Candidatus Nanoarchaeia archaeon]|nr:DUF378 domain-containing protein [Candidatus Nanoarchaeia archaeon]
MAKASNLEWIAWIIVIIGGLNWGLVGFFNFNLVTTLLGDGMGSRIVYDIIGVASLYGAWLMTQYAKKKK